MGETCRCCFYFFLHLNQLEKEEQKTLKIIRREEIKKIRAEINEKNERNNNKDQ